MPMENNNNDNNTPNNDDNNDHTDHSYRTRPAFRSERFLKITVFTSKSCLLCEQAITTLNEVAQRIRKYGPELEIVEQPIDDTHTQDLIRIDTLPAIRIGDHVMLGLPSPDDLESFININYLSQLPE